MTEELKVERTGNVYRVTACVQFTTLKSAQAFMNTVIDRGDAGAPERIPAKEMTSEQYERLLAKCGLTNPATGSLAVPADPTP